MDRIEWKLLYVDRVEIYIWSRKFLVMIWKLQFYGGNYKPVTMGENMKLSTFRCHCILQRFRRNSSEIMYQMYGMTRKERIAETGRKNPTLWNEEDYDGWVRFRMPKKEAGKKEIKYWKAKRALRRQRGF